MNTLVQSWLDKVRADEQAWVDDHRRARRLTIRCALWLLLALACTTVRVWGQPGWVDAAGGLVLGAFAGVGAISIVRRGTAYRNGWLAGRHRMVLALVEAQDRGLPPEAWLQGERDRDLGVVGLPPTPPDDRFDL